MTETYEPAIKITLNDIYARVVAVETSVAELSSSLPQHVSITKAKQDEYEARLENHGTRLSTLDTRITILETKQTPKAPWYSIVGGVVGIISGVGGLVALLAILAQLGQLSN